MGLRHSPVSAKDVGMAGSDQGPSKGRRIVFRVLAAVTALWLLAAHVFGLLELVLMWLPDQTLSAMFEEDVPNIAAHRTHFVSVGILAWAVVLAIAAQLRRPERRVAQMLQLLAITIGAAVVYALSGTAGEWLVEEGTLLLPVALLVLLHPRARDFWRKPGFDHLLARLAAVAAIPWAVFIVVNGRQQLLNVAGDSHAEMEHWATAALMGIVIVVSAFLGSSDHDGWRLPAWVAAAASVVYGVHSLVFPGLASALALVWAVAAIAWGVAFVAAVVRRSRATKTPAAG